MFHTPKDAQVFLPEPSIHNKVIGALLIPIFRGGDRIHIVGTSGTSVAACGTGWSLCPNSAHWLTTSPYKTSQTIPCSSRKSL